MGNYNCYNQEDIKQKNCLPKRAARVLNVKRKLKKRILQTVTQFEQNPAQSEFQSIFINFFKTTLIKLIIEYQFPKPGQDFLQYGYQISLANLADITDQLQKDEKDMDSLLIRNLIDDINQLKEKSLFYLILQQFNEFYKLLFLCKNDKLDATIISPNTNTHYCSGTKSFINTQIPIESIVKQKSIEYDECTITKRKISSLVKQDESLLQCILISIVSLFEILKDILLLTYSEIFKEYLQLNDIERYVQNNLVFQKIIQHYIYDEAFCVGKLIEITVQLIDQPTLQSDGIIYTEKHTTLDVSLYPEPGQFTMIKELDDEQFLNQSAKIRRQDFYRSSSRMSVIEMQQKIMIAIHQIEQENIPYKELFVILKQMFEEIKPYRIFLLIQQLSEEIVQMYLQQRPQDQQNKYRELILAEDNKLSIILFLLHKFQESTGCNLNRLYNKLKFMMDYDSILDNKIKYEFDQSFVRFYACLEMIVQTP